MIFDAPQSPETWRVFAQSVEDFAFILMDPENRIVDWNTGAEKMLRYEREEVLGRSGEIIFTPEDRAAGAPARELSKSLEQGRAEDERWHLRADGSRFRASGSLTSLKAADGRQIGFAKVLRDVTEREKEREKLEQTLSERTALTREIQHRVKNNLQMIVSLISLQSNRITNRQTLDALQELQTRVRTIAAVHETLYASSDLGMINMGPLLGQITRNLRGIYNGQERIAVELVCADLALDIRDALPVALISNELLANTLKHAFPESRQGRVHVTLEYTDSVGGGAAPREAVLRVGDDGGGIPQGSDFESSHTMGFELIRILTDQLHGRIVVNSDSKGTSFQVFFPIGAP